MEKSQVENLENQRSSEDIIESRINQPYSSRLAEYLTGLKPDDPEMAEKLIVDGRRTRAKYGLPDLEIAKSDPRRYERLLQEIATNIGVDIRDKSECGSFFEDNPFASGVNFDKEKVVATRIDQSTRQSYTKGLTVLEHELIHAKQSQDSPRMPIEVMEYEAYVANLNPDTIISNKEDLNIIFSFLIGGSVNHWYGEKNDNREEDEPEIKPVWDDPEYFLNNVDILDPNDIEGYVSKHG